MSQIFTAFGALRPHDRFKMGVLLREPSTRFPVTEADFAVLPVPRSASTQATFLRGLRDALVPVLDAELSTWSLAALVPGVAELTERVETAPGTTNRLVALVRSNGHRDWAALAGFTIREIRGWHGAGQQMTADLVVAAVATALRSAPVAPRPQTSPSPVASRPSPIGKALDAFLDGLPDARGRFAFELDELRIDRARPAGDWPAAHQFLGLSAERARQLKVTAREQVLAAVRQDAAVELLIGDLATLIGQATDRDGFDTALESVGLPEMSDPVGLLAVWLAGPYRAVPRHDGWWSPHPAELVAETEALLTTGGGVHPLEILIKDLVRFGVTETHAERWLSCQRVRIEHGLVVDLGGRAGDVATRALEATGRAMSFGELCSWMPSEISASALANELRRNPSFIETGPDHWELADWGGEPSKHLVRIGIEVTPEVVSGADAELSSEIACLLGLLPDMSMTLATRFGPMAVSYDGSRVRRGSARPVVLASGAAIGDVLWFVVDPRDSVVEVTVDPATSANEPSTIQPPMTATTARSTM